MLFSVYLSIAVPCIKIIRDMWEGFNRKGRRRQTDGMSEQRESVCKGSRSNPRYVTAGGSGAYEEKSFSKAYRICYEAGEYIPISHLPADAE